MTVIICHNTFLWRITAAELCSAILPRRPVSFDPSHHQFNSDHSQLTIHSVVRADYGMYVCTAINKIAESSATIMLHVFGWFTLPLLNIKTWTSFTTMVLLYPAVLSQHLWMWLQWKWWSCFISEAPEVSVSADQQIVSVGERVSVACNVTGHPQPALHWLNKYNGMTTPVRHTHTTLFLSTLVTLPLTFEQVFTSWSITVVYYP